MNCAISNLSFAAQGTSAGQSRPWIWCARSAKGHCMARSAKTTSLFQALCDKNCQTFKEPHYPATHAVKLTRMYSSVLLRVLHVSVYYSCLGKKRDGIGENVRRTCSAVLTFSPRLHSSRNSMSTSSPLAVMPAAVMNDERVFRRSERGRKEEV